eukprot:CAMPEP_0194309828 /NCGR_PEP_ID=MMETSP0171-20130528/6798_1 /TAXON_ID=218684 /ORGANISM="Corethron pennatum, Strain L29A3" /LENGTH=521 /DNA_ID=CAMNT_0039063191 /DNA_START=91 /DNA_END=1653 /DNA_ORIENTATION=-
MDVPTPEPASNNSPLFLPPPSRSENASVTRLDDIAIDLSLPPASENASVIRPDHSEIANRPEEDPETQLPISTCCRFRCQFIRTVGFIIFIEILYMMLFYLVVLFDDDVTMTDVTDVLLVFYIPPLVLVTFAAPISHCCCRKGSMRHNTDLPSQGRAEWLMRISTSYIAASLLWQLAMLIWPLPPVKVFAVVIAPLLFWAEASYWENRDTSLFRKIFSTAFFRNMFQSSEVSSDVLNKGLVISWVTYFSGIIISTLMLISDREYLGSFFATISWIPMLIHVEKSTEHRNKERRIVTAHDALMLPQGLDVEVDSENRQDSDAQTNSERFRRSCANRLRLASISFFVISLPLPFLLQLMIPSNIAFYLSMISSAIAFYLSYEATKMYARESDYCIFQHYFTMFVAFLSFAFGTSLIIPAFFGVYDNNTLNVGSLIILTFNNLMIWCPMFLHAEFAREIASNVTNVESPSSPIPEPIDQDDVQHLSQAAQELEGLVSDGVIDQQQREEMLDKNMFSILFATEPW